MAASATKGTSSGVNNDLGGEAEYQWAGVEGVISVNLHCYRGATASAVASVISWNDLMHLFCVVI